jgi:hypothetical protein
MTASRHLFEFLFILLATVGTAFADEAFAPVGLAADLDAAHYLASRAELEEASELLTASLAASPDDPLAQLAGRELVRLTATIELRESFLAKTAREGGKLRIQIEGKRRALRVTDYTDGVVSFALNKYGIEDIDVSEISLRDMTSNWKNAKAGPVEVRAFALRLAGDKSWKSQWPRDEEGHEEVLADLQGVPDSIVHGERVLDLRSLENYVGRSLDRSEGQKVVALHERLFGGTDPQLEDDEDHTKRHALRALVRGALVAAWGLEELAAGLHAPTYEVIGDELRLIYDFASEEELKDWPQDEIRLPFLRFLGVLRTPETEWYRKLEGGSLEVLGEHDLRHIVPFKGPLHLRYPLQVAKVGKDGGMWMCGTFFHDNLEKTYQVVFGLGYLLQGYERGRPKEIHRDQIYYEIGRNYFVDLTYDKTGLTTVFREDLPEKSVLTLKTRKVDRGHISIGVYTDYITRYDSFEIQGKPDLDQMDRFRDEWVLDRLAEMGY